MSTQHAAPISDQERIKRQSAVNFARGSARFEGYVLDADIEEINRQFIDGNLTWDGHGAAIRGIVLRMYQL